MDGETVAKPLEQSRPAFSASSGFSEENMSVAVDTPASLLTFAVGLIVTQLCGWPVKRLVRGFPLVPTPPSGVDPRAFSAALAMEDHGASRLGYIERTLFFIGVWSHAELLIGGWLAFKVASKWQVWEHIAVVQPGTFTDDKLDDLRVRHYWGTALSQRFLLGTGANVLAALAGWGVSSFVRSLITSQ